MIKQITETINTQEFGTNAFSRSLLLLFTLKYISRSRNISVSKDISDFF